MILDTFLYKTTQKRVTDQYVQVCTRSVYSPGLLTKMKFFFRNFKWMKAQFIWKVDGKVDVFKFNLERS